MTNKGNGWSKFLAVDPQGNIDTARCVEPLEPTVPLQSEQQDAHISISLSLRGCALGSIQISLNLQRFRYKKTAKWFVLSEGLRPKSKGSPLDLFFVACDRNGKGLRVMRQNIPS